MTRSAIASLVLALTLPIAAHADEASRRTKVEELLVLNNTQKTVQQIEATITKQLDDAADRAAGPDATPDQKAKVDDFKKKISQMIDAGLGWTSMKPSVVDIYAKTFTEDQLDAIVAFYKTPAGAALLEKMPDINTQFGQLGNTRIAGLRDQLQKSFQDLQNSLHPIPSLGAPASAAPATGGAK